jgi:putative Holliday junction resolvase
MNYLGIDYGCRRIGLSIGDDELRLAVPIKAIQVYGIKGVIEELAGVVKYRKILKIIIGYPVNMDGQVGDRAKEVDNFIGTLSEFILVPIERMDERLTSEGVEDLRWRSRKNRQELRKRGTIDSASAVLILQDYFDML